VDHPGRFSVVLFEQRFWPGMADGSISVTYRRWKGHQVVAGRRYRTPAGFIVVDSLDIVDESSITKRDATRAGYPTVDAVKADLRGSPELPLYRVAFHADGGGDPRADLAASDRLSEDDIADIGARLARLDRASSHGPWTRVTLDLIAAHPGRRAGDLCTMVDRELQPFKLDVRKLKTLGLTTSSLVGYELSPRGQAFLERIA
jgi:hypothetical protein